ncbi:DUF1565 domain-containing protein [Oculatella sp. LEGE 06141]|uniref:DUF1565 domain-containing protein n=1 Tax=Oculatella sp. LEGE 06141 TaxID=1828648 RepID=UPI0018802EF0|nr:DUF1565 domain-containing protein [Oculatella sp. LEGE 06141]MBE9180743.1 DUF1565 domain-containing protein [Oculatella sp. LEGE 06141]
MGSMYPHSDRYSAERLAVPLTVSLQPSLLKWQSIAPQPVQELSRSEPLPLSSLKVLVHVGLMAAVCLSGLGVRAVALETVPEHLPEHQVLLAQAAPSASQQLLFVNPSVGNDTGDGSQRSPFRTISRALELSQPNTVIILATGTYSTETGESFPIRLKSGVTLQGDPATQGRGIVIRGGGVFASPTSANQNVAVLGATEAVITGVTVTNPNPRGYGLWIESSNPTVASNTFSGSTHDGISVTGDGAPTIQANAFVQNGANGITVFGTSRAEIRENVFERTGFGINVAQNAAPQIIGNRISQNQDGVVVQANARPVLRDNTIEGNVRDGLVAIAQSQPDLGTAAQAGNNTFRNNGRHDINAEAARQPFPAAGNQVAAERTVGQVDMAGTVAITPAPVASRPVLPTASPSAAPNRLPTPTPAAPAPIAVSSEQISPDPNSLSVATSDSFNPATSAGSSAPGGFSALPRLQSSVPNSLSAGDLPPSNTGSTALPASDDSLTATTFPTPAAAPAPVPRRASATNPATTVRPLAAAPAAIDIPVPAPATASPPTRSETAQPTQTAAASAPIDISVPPPATTATQPSSSRPDARDILIQRPSSANTARPTSSPSGAASPAAIEIPVPPPATSSVPAPGTNSRQTVARSSEAVVPLPQANLLPVPGSDIPVGNIAGMPTVAISRDPLQRVALNSAVGSSQAAALGLRYRVVVEAENEGMQAQVRSLIPGAFRTYANGRLVMQAGAYSDRANAEDAARMLNNSGLRAIVQSVE